MGLLIDSSVLIDIERECGNARGLVEEFGGEGLAIAAISASELLVGGHLLARKIAASRSEQERSDLEVKRTRDEAFIEEILSLIPIIPFDLRIARVHARADADLEAAGSQVEAHDLIIGTTAIALDFAVVTADLRSFPRIPGLRVRKRIRLERNPPRRKPRPRKK